MFTSSTAGRPRRSTATTPVIFQLDNIAPVGASGLLIKGSQDIEVQLAANVRYGQEGDDFSNGSSLPSANFDCQGVMGWEVMAVDTSVSPNLRKYLITGQTSLSLADPINLETGDVDGVLPEGKGGTGLTSISALHQALEALGFEPLYPDLPTISASMLMTTAHIAGVNPVDTTAADVTLTIPSSGTFLTLPIGTQLRYLRRGVLNELIIAAQDGSVTLEFPTGSAPVARQHLSEIFLRKQGTNNYRLSGDLRVNSPTNIAGGSTLSDAHRGIILRLTGSPLLVPAASALSFGFYVTILVDSSSLTFTIDGTGGVDYGPITGFDTISIWKTTAGILLAGKGATSPQLVSI